MSWVLEVNHSEKCKTPRLGCCQCKRSGWTITGDGFIRDHFADEKIPQKPRRLKAILKAVSTCGSIKHFMKDGENYRIRNVKTGEVIPVELFI